MKSKIFYILYIYFNYESGRIFCISYMSKEVHISCMKVVGFPLLHIENRATEQSLVYTDYDWMRLCTFCDENT